MLFYQSNANPNRPLSPAIVDTICCLRKLGQLQVLLIQAYEE